MHIGKSCDCGRNKADRYVRAGVSQRTAPAMIFPWGGSETDAIPKQSGTLLATTTGTFNDTPALDALKASCGAPISMGRGEIPVRLAATSRLFCLRKETKCKAVELADKCLPVCSTAFWLKLEEIAHNGSGGGDT